MKRVIIDGEKTELLSLTEAAKFLGISERTMRTYIREGRIPSCKVKRRIYIWSRNLQQYLRGARTTRTYKDVAPPKFDALTFDAPPDPFYD